MTPLVGIYRGGGGGSPGTRNGGRLGSDGGEEAADEDRGVEAHPKPVVAPPEVAHGLPAT